MKWKAFRNIMNAIRSSWVQKEDGDATSPELLGRSLFLLMDSRQVLLVLLVAGIYLFYLLSGVMQERM
jgi:hypothetical protein